MGFIYNTVGGFYRSRCKLFELKLASYSVIHPLGFGTAHIQVCSIFFLVEKFMSISVFKDSLQDAFGSNTRPAGAVPSPALSG